MQAGDECRTGTVQQRDVLAGAAEQISALDLLQRHVTAIQLHSKLLIGRAERPLDTRPAQEKPADSFGVAGLIRDRRLTELLVIGPEAIGNLDRTRSGADWQRLGADTRAGGGVYSDSC